MGDIMERDLLRLMLSQDTREVDMEDMVMGAMVAMGMAVDTMARERLKLSQDILEDMAVMDMDVDIMARGWLMLNQDISEDMVVMAVHMGMEVMDMVDMAIMVRFTFEFYSQL